MEKVLSNNAKIDLSNVVKILPKQEPDKSYICSLCGEPGKFHKGTKKKTTLLYGLYKRLLSNMGQGEIPKTTRS
jgi:hypothetical protein